MVAEGGDWVEVDPRTSLHAGFFSFSRDSLPFLGQGTVQPHVGHRLPVGRGHRIPIPTAGMESERGA